jgi:hypothetical protein
MSDDDLMARLRAGRPDWQWIDARDGEEAAARITELEAENAQLRDTYEDCEVRNMSLVAENARLREAGNQLAEAMRCFEPDDFVHLYFNGSTLHAPNGGVLYQADAPCLVVTATTDAPWKHKVALAAWAALSGGPTPPEPTPCPKCKGKGVVGGTTGFSYDVPWTCADCNGTGLSGGPT